LIAIDTNLLVYAHRADAREHARALEVLSPIFEGTPSWALPWPCVHEFIAICTHPRIYLPPSTLNEAFAFLKVLFASPSLHLISEGPLYFERLIEVAGRGRSVGPRIHDARIAALCLQHGVSELWTADRDFSLFPQLKTRNPLL
jgi:toxin-antitoxin system PIN domain toxin